MTLGAQPALEAALRLALAFVLVLPLGWERAHRARSVGLRTFPLLSVCVCAFLLLSQSGERGPTEPADAFYGVLTGIGFVGSGAIVKSLRGAQGLTTAVSLWVSGAVGAGLAFGDVALSAALAAMSAAALFTPSLGRAVVPRGRGTR